MDTITGYGVALDLTPPEKVLICEAAAGKLLEVRYRTADGRTVALPPCTSFEIVNIDMDGASLVPGMLDAAPPIPTADDFATARGYVEFYADGEEAPCERLTLRIDEVDGDGYTYFSLYCDGTRHDGFSSLEEVARSFPKVAADLDGWKSNHLAPFAVVRAAAFDLAGIEDPGTPGEHDEGSDDQDDEDEDEEG